MEPASAVRRTLPLVAGLVLLGGCSRTENLVVLRLDDQAHIGRAIVSQAGGSVDLTRRNMGALVSQDESSRNPNHVVDGSETMLKDDEVIGTFAGAMAGQPREPTVWVVYFPPAGTDILPTSADTLAAAITAGQLSLFADISVVGHTDATGTPEENRILSLQRASRIRDALVQAGVNPAGIEVSAVGAGQPLEAPASDPANRAVEITVR